MFKKVLVPLDRSALAEQALGQAVAIARQANAGIDIVCVHQFLPYGGFDDAPWLAPQWDDEMAYVSMIASEIESGGTTAATFAVPKGDVAEEICRRAIEVDADLIVMTSHGRTGLSRMWLGSVADAVIRNAQIPVLMLRPIDTKAHSRSAHHLFKHILVTLDGSKLSEEILSPAAALARCGPSRITVLRVVEPVPLVVSDGTIPFAYPPPVPDSIVTQALVEDATAETDRIVSKLRDEGLDAHSEIVVDARVAAAIIDFASNHAVNLVAMSTHGRGASRLFLGSVADKVIRATTLPVLLQRPIGVRNVERLAEEASTMAESPALAHV